jgi:CRISPR/Cas system-associated exonuclease Cas4 (RecB family)
MIVVADPVTDANAIAEKLTGRSYLSWSAVSTYLKCPLRHQYRYLDQLPEEFISSNLMFGGAIHAALETFFRERLASRRSLGIEALMAVYHESWIGTDLSRVHFGKGEDLAGHGRLAERMLQAFLASQASRPSGAIVGIEEELRAPVITDCPDLLARLDLIVESEDEILITDFKTSRARWSSADAIANEGQLLIYHELIREFADKPIKLQFAVITKTKQPDVELRTIAPEPQKIERIRRLVQNVWTNIQFGRFYPVPSAMNCPTCGYRDQCSRWTG